MKKDSQTILQEKAILIASIDTRFQLESTKYYIFALIFLSNVLCYILSGYPQGLETALQSPPFDFSGLEYGIFYGICSFPNIILPLFIGIHIDKNGFSSLLILILSLFTFCGAIIITVGSHYVSWGYMCLGRLLLGVGVENIGLILKKILLQITTKDESVAAWGLFLVSNRIGSMIASWFPPYFYSITESVTSSFFVAILFDLALIIFLFFALILTTKTQTLHTTVCTTGEISSWSILKNFSRETPWVFWIMTLLNCINFYVFYGFFSSANSFLTKEANLDSVDASYFLIIFSTFCGLFQPFIGYLFSKIGYYVYAIIIGSLINLSAFSLFLIMYGTDDSYLVLIPILLLGFGYSCCSTFVFSGFGVIVSPKNHGLAYGMLQNCLNIGALAGPLVFGIVKDMTRNYDDGYFWAIMETLIAQGLIGVLGVVILVVDFLTIKSLSVKRQIV